jgi:4-amino-4-deoxychorismate lyase
MFWYNGQLVEKDELTLSIHHPSLLYGAMVFTTLRVYGRSLEHPLTHWAAHCDRLDRSLQVFGWPSPNWTEIRQGVERLLPHYPVIRVAIFPDATEWIIGRALPQDLAGRQQKGSIGWVAQDDLFERSLSHHKTANYLGAWLALNRAQHFGANEAILVDRQGSWLETSTGNLWGWKKGCWYTPELKDGLLPGIARSNLLSWLEQQQISVRQNHWTTQFIQDLDVVAYSNSVIEVVPFAQIWHQGVKWVLSPTHPVLEQLRGYYQLSVTS